MVEELKDILVVEDSNTEPKDVVAYASKGANMLHNLLAKRKDKVMINNKQFLQFQDWQTIAKFYRSTASVEWTKPIMKGDAVIGWEAKANVLNERGIIISSAESSCSRDEETWKARADFQLRSMAQTRACAKALRNVFSWVAVLAGYEATPAEEMTEAKIVSQDAELKCSHCGTKVKSSVFDFSMQKYGRSLCFVHQKELDATGTLQ